MKQLAPIVGGGGGGRPDFAEAGGKDPSKIGEMLAAAGCDREMLAYHDGHDETAKSQGLPVVTVVPSWFTS